MELLEVEYLLLALDFGEILFLLAGFGPLQAALLKVFESGRHGRALHRPRGVTAVLWSRHRMDESLRVDLQSLTALYGAYTHTHTNRMATSMWFIGHESAAFTPLQGLDPIHTEQ